MGNPLNSFLLIKSLTSDWKEVQNVISSSPSETFLANLTSQREGMKWPSDEDLNGAAVALLRLQDTYKLDTDDLAKGELNGVNYGTALKAHDCFELGRQSYNNGDHYHTLLWMKQALKKWEEETVKTVDRADILEYLAFSSYTQGNIRKALKWTNELLELRPDHPRAGGNKVYYESTLKSQGGSADRRKRGEDGLGDDDVEEALTVAEEMPQPEEVSDERKAYEQLCRGEDALTEKYKKELKCRYYHGHHPYLRIAPYKEETMFLKPRLVLYHDVLSDQEIHQIKTMATPNVSFRVK